MHAMCTTQEYVEGRRPMLHIVLHAVVVMATLSCECSLAEIAARVSSPSSCNS